MQRTFYIHLCKAKPDLLTPFKVSLLIANYAFLWDRADLATSFASLKNVYLNPKSNVRNASDTSASILPNVSISY